MTANMDIEIITTPESLLTIFTRKFNSQMLPFNVLVHVCRLVACVEADGTAPNLLSSRIKSLNHLALDYCIKL